MTVRVTEPGPAADEPLTVTALTCPRNDVLILRVAGEIDLVTIERLREHLPKHMTGTQCTN